MIARIFAPVVALIGLCLAAPALAESFSDFLHAFKPTAIASGGEPDRL